MLRALQDAKLAGTVTFVGFDSSAKLVQALRDGHIDALILQDPMRMGYLGVKTMFRHLSGGQVGRRVDTGVHVVTAANMDAPDMKRLLQPDLDRWLK
jgi:ribose transport system substrate-binding protein